LRDVGLGRLFGTSGDELAFAVTLFEPLAHIAHEGGVAGVVPAILLILQLDFHEFATVEIENGALESGLEQAFDVPSFLAVDKTLVDDGGLGTDEELLKALRGLAPAQAKGRVDFLGARDTGPQEEEHGGKPDEVFQQDGHRQEFQGDRRAGDRR
jgi:hypothetical protein